MDVFSFLFGAFGAALFELSLVFLAEFRPKHDFLVCLTSEAGSLHWGFTLEHKPSPSDRPTIHSFDTNGPSLLDSANVYRDRLQVSIFS